MSIIELWNGGTDIKSLIRKMLIATIILAPLDIVRVFDTSISFFRLILIVTLLMAIIDIISSGSIEKGRYLYFVILISLSPISYLVSSNKSRAFSFLLNDYMGLILVFLFANYFTSKDLKKLLKTFVQSQYITIGFGVYSLYYFYFAGGIPLNIHFMKVLSISLSEHFLEATSISGFARLSLPYTTPPHLSIIMSITLCILIFTKDIYSKYKRTFLIAIFSLILILTFSRTGVVAFALAYIIAKIFRGNYKIKPINIIKYTILIFALVFVLASSESRYIAKLIDRFTVLNISEDRHFLVPIEGLIIWLSGLKNFVLGIGYRSSENMIGRYTFLPPHFLNSYVTLITEKGLIGLLLVKEYFILLTGSLTRLSIRNLNSEYKALCYSVIVMSFSFMTYEARQNISIWIIVAIAMMMESKKNIVWNAESQNELKIK